jgi:hypothetical protein
MVKITVLKKYCLKTDTSVKLRINAIKTEDLQDILKQERRRSNHEKGEF